MQMSLYEHTASGVKWILIVALDADALAWSRCVDVFAVTDVDADMVWALAAPENEVARLEAVEGDLAHDCDLIIGGTWQADAVLCENILDKAAAVEAVRGRAAPDVRYADVVHGIADDIACSGIIDAVEDLFFLFFINDDIALRNINIRQSDLWCLCVWCRWRAWVHWCDRGLAIVLAVEVLSGCEHGIDGSLEVWSAWLGINSPTNEGGVCGLRWGSTYAKYGNSTKSDRYGPFFQIQEGSRPSFDGACR